MERTPVKSLLSLLLALALLVILTAAAQAEEVSSPLGDWYAEIGGMPLQLTLTEDGSVITSLTYAVTVPSLVPEAT